jgi:tetratricopeptide (TPR) repeat protein
MKKIFLVLQINSILLLYSSVLLGQDTDLKNAKKHFDRGIAAIETAESLEDFNDAIKEFETAKTLAPDWADIYYNLGIVYEKAERYDEAINNLQHYIKITPNADDAEEIQTMITKIEYKNEKAFEKQNKYKDLIGVWDRYDSETGEIMDEFTFLYKDGNLMVKAMGGIGSGGISVPVKFDGQKLEFNFLDKKIQYDSETEFSYTIVGKGLMKGYIKVNVIRTNPGFPVKLGQKPPMPMELRKR